MKSVAIASALFASLALAAPLDRRAYATKTHTVVETVVVYTTVWDGQEATQAPAPTSSPALFFEQPSSSVVAVTSEAVPETPEPSSAPAPVAPSSSEAAPIPSSTPVVEAPSPTPEIPSPTPEPEPSPEPTPEPTPTPAPEPSPEPSPEPAPAPSSAAPAAPVASEASSSGGSTGGESFAGSLTMNYYNGGLGACGQPIQDTEMVAALAVAGFGDSSYDPATGNPTNKWCGQKIRITYNGKSADATIMDRCPGCTGVGGLDATPALWEALTGGLGGASGDRLDTGMTFSLVN